ncbi:hypothetical protein QBC37DRAFT_463549 [Rhypophila decipiens]|uniref:Heterokaryon incompatibility domain-containing protein n=1 Tax=Rhypophila decipiens TaxID=261697 RepID=A0AAN7B7Z1_9PEZI|nr:hypothetical protein QBC37DRAFT_463549 [Rhypophila decipiens]
MMTNPDHKKKKGYDKIDMTCKLALQEDGLDYAWVDTCCIDKPSSAELSEAINSMFRWYQRSTICYGYLSDLQPSAQFENGLKDCRWWTRGWTLQELIAPTKFYFYDSVWKCWGSKRRFAQLVSQITGINIKILNHQARLSSVPVARRMAWAARRETTRIEDRAYSLLGIFGVNMPMLYGEEEKAVRRLQEEIIKQTADLSIFSWKLPASTRPAHGEEMASGILARSPDYFAECPLPESGYIHRDEDLSIANNRVRADAKSFIIRRPATGPRILYMVLHGSNTTRICVRVMSFGANDFVRFDPWSLCSVDGECHLFADPLTKISILCDVTEADDLGNYACLMRSFLLDRRGPFLHFQTSPGLDLYSCSPGGRFDPTDQIIQASNLCMQDFSLAWLNFSIDTPPLAVNSDNPGPLSRIYAFVAMGWSRYDYLNIHEAINKIQFTILDTSEHEDVIQALLEFIMGREDTVMNHNLVRWLNRHQLHRASCIVQKLPEFGGQCLKVSVKPSIASDTELSRDNFLRFTFISPWTGILL